LKKIFKFIGYTILTLITLVLVYLIVAYCLSRITVNKELGAASDVAIYITTNGVHTDLVLPVKHKQMDWSKEIKFSNTAINDTTMEYVGMGWGDKGFYLETPKWSDLKFSIAFKAAFGLGTTAIHTTFYKNLQESKSCKKIIISNEQYLRLVNYITNSLKKDSAGHVIKIFTNANYGNTDAFYEAKGSYSLLHTCNTWANNGLKRSGQKACLWTPFDTGIFLKY
jgi:uncharacterized protein (TIGR02117 family)